LIGPGRQSPLERPSGDRGPPQIKKKRYGFPRPYERGKEEKGLQRHKWDLSLGNLSGENRKGGKGKVAWNAKTRGRKTVISLKLD